MILCRTWRLLPIASALRGRELAPEERAGETAEEPGGVGERDGEDDGRVQQDEDGCAAGRRGHGPAEERERPGRAAGSFFCFFFFSSLIYFFINFKLGLGRV